MKDIMGMMGKVKEMQEKMASLQSDLDAATAEGDAGGGAVRVTLAGNGELRAVHIDPSLLVSDEAEILEDLILAAHNKARAAMDEMKSEKMREMTAGLPIPPGMKLPF